MFKNRKYSIIENDNILSYRGMAPKRRIFDYCKERKRKNNHTILQWLKIYYTHGEINRSRYDSLVKETEPIYSSLRFAKIDYRYSNRNRSLMDAKCNTVNVMPYTRMIGHCNLSWSRKLKSYDI